MTINQDIRVVGLDLDGTLLRDDKTISEYTRTILSAAIERGIYILPATGRTRTAVPECVRSIEGIQYGVCSNGAAVVDLETGEEFYSCKLSLEEACQLMERIESYHTMYDCYIEGQGYTERRFFEELDYYQVEPKIQEMIRQTRNPVDNLLEEVKKMGHPVEKINMFFRKPEDRQKALEELSTLPFVKVTSSLTNNLEINTAACNKGAALLGFAQKKGFTREQVMCCGDGNNDFDMIRMSGVGVAMMNGESQIKEIADYITYTNEEDGAARAIKRLCMRLRDLNEEKMA